MISCSEKVVITTTNTGTEFTQTPKQSKVTKYNHKLFSKKKYKH